jgi:alanine racemase
VTAGVVLVRGTRIPIVGPISIEHTRLDLTALPGAEAGDEVVVIGSQGGERITVDDVVKVAGLVGPVDVSLALAGRVPRAYRRRRSAASGSRPGADATAPHGRVPQ